jgi:hypothetical protein
MSAPYDDLDLKDIDPVAAFYKPQIDAEGLRQYVGRYFRLQKTRYGWLDGYVGYVKAVDLNDDVATLIVAVLNHKEVKLASMLPSQFNYEVFLSAEDDATLYDTQDASVTEDEGNF